MPHETPFPAVSDTENAKTNPNPNSKAPPHPELEHKMTSTEKENGQGTPAGPSFVKVPIPEHIHDVHAKTFYKIGQFLVDLSITFR